MWLESTNKDMDLACCSTLLLLISAGRLVYISAVIVMIYIESMDTAVFIFYVIVSGQVSDFRFSTIYGDHMVLQQAPNQANIWGYTSDCSDNISINFSQNDYPATLIKGKQIAF